MQWTKREPEALVEEVKATTRKLQVGERISPECQDRYVQPGRQPAQRRKWDPGKTILKCLHLEGGVESQAA